MGPVAGTTHPRCGPHCHAHWDGTQVVLQDAVARPDWTCLGPKLSMYFFTSVRN
jgi:hypothetical protein